MIIVVVVYIPAIPVAFDFVSLICVVVSTVVIAFASRDGVVSTAAVESSSRVGVAVSTTAIESV